MKIYWTGERGFIEIDEKRIEGIAEVCQDEGLIDIHISVRREKQFIKGGSMGIKELEFDLIKKDDAYYFENKDKDKDKDEDKGKDGKNK